MVACLGVGVPDGPCPKVTAMEQKQANATSPLGGCNSVRLDLLSGAWCPWSGSFAGQVLGSGLQSCVQGSGRSEWYNGDARVYKRLVCVRCVVTTGVHHRSHDA
jgi:hypothetical protein